jgi:hypothetical protein
MSDPKSPSPIEAERAEPAVKKMTRSVPAGLFVQDGESAEENERSTPADYDDYYLRIVKEWLRYACPVGAILYVSFSVLEWFSGATSGILIKTLALRLASGALLFALWAIAPRIKSVRTMTICGTIVYLFAFLDLIVILMLLPNGMVVGVAGLLTVIMSASGIFLLRPVAGAVGGSIGLLAFVGASFSSGLTYFQTALGATQIAAAEIIGFVFLVILDREFRKRHALERSLELEKRQSERLLKEILPRYVIQRIREGAQSIAESILEVNVIFIDIVGFTEISRRLAPKHLIEVLGQLFECLDDSCEKYGVTKIKTIGDAYMAMTGLPESSSLSAASAVEFCVEALRSVDAVGRRTGVPLRYLLQGY